MKCNYSVANSSYTSNVEEHRKYFLFRPPIGEQTFSTSYTISLPKGLYKFEAWGSIGSGYVGLGTPGRGAYAKGSIFLPENENKLYLFIGTKKGFNSAEEGQNTGGYGGGATDVRVEDGDWFDFNSLKSRILVAAGGGGTEWKGSIGGFGGELTGGTGYAAPTTETNEPSSDLYAEGGSQTPPNTYQLRTLDFGIFKGDVTAGKFGITYRPAKASSLGGAGGGGYYAGASMDYAGSGGGGSSFISGHKGCLSIFSNSSDFEQIYHTNSSIHYSGYVFHDTLLIAGNKAMPHFSKPVNEGNDQEGALRITLLSYKETCQVQKHIYINVFVYVFVFNTK